MKTVNATDVKNRFGEYLETAIAEPLAVSKNGRTVAVLMSWAQYERLDEIEDAWWAMRAMEAEKGGYLGRKESMAALKSLLNEHENRGKGPHTRSD
jgi:prevent-host-death family protein